MCRKATVRRCVYLFCLCERDPRTLRSKEEASHREESRNPEEGCYRTRTLPRSQAPLGNALAGKLCFPAGWTEQRFIDTHVSNQNLGTWEKIPVGVVHGKLRISASSRVTSHAFGSPSPMSASNSLNVLLRQPATRRRHAVGRRPVARRRRVPARPSREDGLHLVRACPGVRNRPGPGKRLAGVGRFQLGKIGRHGLVVVASEGQRASHVPAPSRSESAQAPMISRQISMRNGLAGRFPAQREAPAGSVCVQVMATW